jgi:UDP-glucose 4-epimerase
MAGCDFVFHLAANADVRFGTEHTRRDLEQNTIATYNVLEAMRANGIKRIAFSSTGSTYGEAEVIPTPEDAPFPVQTSLYGASKVAGEGLISAYCEGFGFEGYIFRFVSILGERYTHGHIFDFYQQLIEHPGWLKDPRGRLAEEELPLRPGLRGRHPARRHAAKAAALEARHRTQVYNLGPRSTCR